MRPLCDDLSTVAPRYIHGDPVFSNVLLTDESTVKLIDMRGALGDVLTTQGDVTYDLSKVYQSLCGYDHIILDLPRTERADEMLAELREHFVDFVSKLYKSCASADEAADAGRPVSMRDVRMLTAVHFFSIVPLHDVREHQEAYLLQCHKMLTEEGALGGSG